MKHTEWVRCLKKRLPGAALHTATAGIFLLVGYLTGAPLMGMLYAALLCLCVGAVGTAVSIRREMKLHRCLLALPPLTPDASLPAARTLIEEDWRALALQTARARQAAQDEMDRRQRERDEYTALWAHQIKVPISAMKLLLQGGAASPTALSAELLKMEQYVEMTLGYDRLCGPTDYVLRACDVNAVMLRCARRFGPLFIQKKLKLNYQPTTLSVITDEKWLGFVLDQLLSNAVKYTARGSVTLRADQTGQTLMVEDTGIGIAPEDLPRIFDHGYTGLNGRWDKHSTGLGLYLSKRVLEKLGHTIQIESQVGRGTCVTVCLARETVDPAS